MRGSAKRQDHQSTAANLPLRLYRCRSATLGAGQVTTLTGRGHGNMQNKFGAYRLQPTIDVGRNHDLRPRSQSDPREPCNSGSATATTPDIQANNSPHRTSLMKANHSRPLDSKRRTLTILACISRKPVECWEVENAAAASSWHLSGRCMHRQCIPTTR